MKGLEILEHVKNAPEFMGGDERYKRSINSPIKYIEDIMTIKQYLEVLEILHNKRVDIRLLAIYVFIPISDEEKLKSYNKFCKHIKHELTMEELLKLKKWLEEHKDE